MLIRCAELFPDFLPEDRVPEFLIYSPTDGFSIYEIDTALGPYNQASGLSPLTLWDITVGADEAAPYFRKFSVEWERPAEKQFLEQIYYFLRGVDPPGVSSAAGLEGMDLPAPEKVDPLTGEPAALETARGA